MAGILFGDVTKYNLKLASPNMVDTKKSVVHTRTGKSSEVHSPLSSPLTMHSGRMRPMSRQKTMYTSVRTNERYEWQFILMGDYKPVVCAVLTIKS